MLLSRHLGGSGEISLLVTQPAKVDQQVRNEAEQLDDVAREGAEVLQRVDDDCEIHTYPLQVVTLWAGARVSVFLKAAHHDGVS